MKFLLDTNIFIPLEPGRLSDISSNSRFAVELHEKALSGQHHLYLHPAAKLDLARDKDASRAQVRAVLVRKYPELPDPPPLTEGVVAEVGEAEVGSNDWVDHHLLAALDADAIDFQNRYRTGTGRI